MTYPIGTPGTPWSAAHKREWLARQTPKRDYFDDVVAKIEQLPEDWQRQQYGTLGYANRAYPLFLLTSTPWKPDLPTILVTGGVHGYETSGVMGALGFAGQASAYQSRFNFVIAPCISPWAYETINRWNPDAIDPNRSFYPDSPCRESALLMTALSEGGWTFLAHFDLHETTDSDNSEFRPALAARDGVTHDNWNIPDGFYVVDDTAHPKPGFQKAIIDSVSSVTHIAPADANGNIIGSQVEQPGVIYYDKASLHLCGSVTDADYVTTTEVYPDSDEATPQSCIEAQVAAIRGGLDYLSQQD